MKCNHFFQKIVPKKSSQNPKRNGDKPYRKLSLQEGLLGSVASFRFRLLCLLMILGLFVISLTGCQSNDRNEDAIRVAMITDISDITDRSFNQATYEGCRTYCQEKGYPFRYYKPIDDNDESRSACVHMAISDGYNVIVMPGYTFASTTVEFTALYPNVRFLSIDCTDYDLALAAFGEEEANGGALWDIPKNLTNVIYQEEVSGYLAGYAAVKEGYRSLGFIGGLAIPAVIRFGYGYLQGMNQAAMELGVSQEVSVKYTYAGQFFGDADITAAMDTWCANNDTEVIFACGGDLYVSVAEAASKNGIHTKVIGVDSDQSELINLYKENLCLTSAMKDLELTVRKILQSMTDGNWEQEYAGEKLRLGIVSENPEDNFVQLPLESWSMKQFRIEDYRALVKRLFAGELIVSDNIDDFPTNLQISVYTQAQIK